MTYSDLTDLMPSLPDLPQRHLNLLFADDGRDERPAAADAVGGGGKSEQACVNALWMSASPPVDGGVRAGPTWHTGEFNRICQPLSTVNRVLMRPTAPAMMGVVCTSPRFYVAKDIA